MERVVGERETNRIETREGGEITTFENKMFIWRITKFLTHAHHL